MTLLTYPITRETRKCYNRLPVIVTLSPSGSQEEALIGLRLKGRRTLYVIAVSDVYRMAALQFGAKEAKARREARKAGIPWKRAKRDFIKANSLPPAPKRKRKTRP